LPNVVDVVVHDPTHFDATVRVAVGPVRGSFKLKAELQPDPAARHIDIKVSGGGFGSFVDMTASADIVDAGDATTTMNWRGAAEVRGPVAAVGGRVLDSQAQKLIAQTFTNIREKLSQ
jgi:carbon monoxide dehydrogenase subunit G